MKQFGLGPGIIGRMEVLPYSKLFRVAARFHDIAYTNGGSNKDKQRADKLFYRMMREVSEDWFSDIFAKFYYISVKNFGWLFYNYHKEFIGKVY